MRPVRFLYFRNKMPSNLSHNVHNTEATSNVALANVARLASFPTTIAGAVGISVSSCCHVSPVILEFRAPVHKDM